jgi:uncharacterized membrane protein
MKAELDEQGVRSCSQRNRENAGEYKQVRRAAGNLLRRRFYGMLGIMLLIRILGGWSALAGLAILGWQVSALMAGALTLSSRSVKPFTIFRDTTPGIFYGCCAVFIACGCMFLAMSYTMMRKPR